jgi:hypothetical protein
MYGETMYDLEHLFSPFQIGKLNIATDFSSRPTAPALPTNGFCTITKRAGGPYDAIQEATG